MIVGIGTDLCEIGRVQKALERHGERFARKILVESELLRYGRHRKPAAYLAKRFAAKEAFSKAMGTGIHFPVNWHNVSVENGPSGRPMLRFSEPLRALLRERGITAAHLSLSDETGMACAFVVLEGD
ncbi:MAG: holo-ACP synthase [Betaproteobacteria bacterium RIFCSPLOWO2_12_FULL_63_13]|nr:MAG: holo-ACP synthase [Betaproteobacteria bacterium RIFCSPLOWO2_02_FULL_63_19]OGA51854.1 MAG: holo-ACP synthase [Betaproteobacteria bacterium RIFCSPLOWO2_12_FULL_63_13]